MGISHGGESMSQYFYTLISNGGLLTFLYIIPTVFVALYVREYSRTYAARRMGLLVEEKKGFFKYFSVAGYIVAVRTGMGWGKSSEVRLSGEKILTTVFTVWFFRTVMRQNGLKRLHILLR